MHVKLTSRHYRRSLLAQGGMEIACTVFFRMPSALKNAQLAERYLQLVKERYTEPKDEKILGSFITEALPEPADVQTNKQRPVPNKSKRNTQPNRPNRDIRDMFKVAQKKSKPTVINID